MTKLILRQITSTNNIVKLHRQVKHYGVGHCRTVDLFVGESPSSSEESQKLAIYKASLGFGEFRCNISDSEVGGCSAELGSRLMLSLHQSTSHLLRKLHSLYHAHCQIDETSVRLYLPIIRQELLSSLFAEANKNFSEQSSMDL